MCGICGIASKAPGPWGPVVRRMNEAQRHRGPDGQGYYVEGTGAPFSDAAACDRGATLCALGHARLAVLDPAGGAQPMAGSTGDSVILFNGEIYNFRELRAELEHEGRRFDTDCDTEVLLQLYALQPDRPDLWLARLNGIFALALWDARRKRLLLARDPWGVKPLHVVEERERVLFASEIKGLLAAGPAARLNTAALHVFLNVRYVPGEETLFRNVHRFPPGHYAWVERGALSETAAFYHLPPAANPSATAADSEALVRTAFETAVARQLLSDVPVGVTLSGGLDSSMLVAAATAAYRQGRADRSGDRILRSFTLGLNEPTDELEDAQLVAEHFGTRHRAATLPADPMRDMREVIRAVEEPKINILQGYKLAGFVHKHVKVVLGGLGGDELFAGYDIHRFCNTLGRLHAWTPSGLRRRLLAPLSRVLWKATRRSGSLRADLPRIGAQIALSAGDRTEFYCRLRNAWDFDAAAYDLVYADPERFRACRATGTYFGRFFGASGNYLEQVLRAEFQTKMVNDFLLNEDRVTSSHGIEGRVPFLDRDLVELAFGIPAAAKMRGAETKALWKRSVCGVLPPRILRKKKQGFTFSSYHQWMKDLRPTVERELTPDWCRDTGLFNHGLVRRVLDYPPHPNLRWHYFMLWMMLGVKTWMEVFNVTDPER